MGLWPSAGRRRGYRGVEIEGVRILRSGQKRGITRTLKAMIHGRSAIEPAIGHTKMDGRLRRNPLKGALGDALHAVMCGAGHNLRMILAKLRLLCARLWLTWLRLWQRSRCQRTSLSSITIENGIVQGGLITYLEYFKYDFPEKFPQLSN